jgi:hypothetical protein
MAISLDQSTTTQTYASAGGSSNLSFGTAPTPGAFVCVFVAGWHDSGYDVSTVTDNQGNGNYSLVRHGTAANKARGVLAYKETVASSGTFTITINHAGGSANYLIAAAASFTGVAASSPLDQTATSSGTDTATDANVTSGATVDMEELVCAVCSVGISFSSDVHLGANAETGYTNVMLYQDFTNICAGSGDFKVVSPTGGAAQSANWSHDATTGGSNGWTAAIATFKAASAAPMFPPFPRFEPSTHLRM